MPRQSYSGKKGRSPFVALYTQEGESAAYWPIGNAYTVCVDAAGAKPLQWLYTPPFDVFAEVHFHLGLLQKTDAFYHYSQLMPECVPAPVAGVGGLVSGGSDAHMMHSQVQTYGRHVMTKLYALAGGTAYTMRAKFGTSGGGFQLYQAPSHLWMIGKAWPR
jgi:hypothetical protein